MGLVAGVITTGLGGGAVASAVGSIVSRLLVSVAASALLSAFQKPPRAPGIQTAIEQTGGINPQSFVVGTYATAGTRVAPLLSHGKVSKTPNAYLTMIRAVSWVPGVTLRRIALNGEWATIGAGIHADYGFELEGRFQDRAWIRFYDGSQTTADAMLLDKYGAHPDFPWSADMRLEGVAYAILTFRYDRKVFTGLPDVRFELGSIPLYDPRKDDTVGGAGSHRWDDQGTWEPSENLAVISYNVLRGIPLLDGAVWGGRLSADEIPISSAVAAMNVCDELVDDGDGGTEAQFTGGFEVSVDRDPAEVLEELAKGYGGWFAEVAGGIRMGAGPAGASVLSFTDNDIAVTRPEEKAPFPGIESVFNGVTATYPDPEALWEPKEADPLLNAAYEAEDGEQRLAGLGFSAVSRQSQVRRLMDAYIDDERRFLRHVFYLPPEAMELEPGDPVDWTSEENGYAAKDFEVGDANTDPLTGFVQVSLKEIDASDWTPPAGFNYGTPGSAPSFTPAAPETVPAWAIAAEAFTDPIGLDRQRIRMSFDPSDLDDVRGVAWVLRIKAGGINVASGTLTDIQAGEIIFNDPLPNVEYEAQAVLIVDRAVTATAWVSATTGSVLVPVQDLATGLGKNLLLNPDAMQGLRFWNYGAADGVGDESSLDIIPAGSSYAGAGMPSFAILQDGVATDGNARAAIVSEVGDLVPRRLAIPIEVGETYMASARFAAIRCQAELVMRWRDDNEDLVGTDIVAIARDDASSTTNPLAWQRVWVKGTAPVGASYLQLQIRKLGTEDGSDSALYFVQPMVEQSHSTAQLPSPWSPAALPLREDVIVANALAEQTISPGADVTILTAAIPTIGLGDIWRRGIQFEVKLSVASGSGTLRLQVRRQAYEGDVWSGWSTAESWDIASDFSTDYAPESDTGSFAATFYATEYRLQVESLSGFDLILRNVQFTARNIGVGL